MSNKKQRALGNKGFSLVELIIVIAIMAILIGVMAPQLLKYVDRSKQAKDTQAVDSVHTALVTALLDPVVEDHPTSESFDSLAKLYENTTYTEFVDLVKEIVGETDAAKIEGSAFESDAYKGQVIKIDFSNNKVTCTVAVNANADGEAIVID